VMKWPLDAKTAIIRTSVPKDVWEREVEEVYRADPLAAILFLGVKKSADGKLGYSPRPRQFRSKLPEGVIKAGPRTMILKAMRLLNPRSHWDRIAARLLSTWFTS